MATQELKKLRTARGYTKASITRLYTFCNNDSDVASSALSALDAKRARVTELFKEYDKYNKEILSLDEEDAEDVEDFEDKYYHVLTVLNEAISRKSSPLSESPAAASCQNNFKAKLPTIKIDVFTDSYTSRAYQLERDDTKDPTITEFLLYLEKRALALENAEPSTSGKSQHKAVVNVTATASTACNYCKSNHRLFDCSKFKMLTSTERIAFSKNNSLCSVCLNKHKGKCRFHFRCSTCKEAHNSLLHPDSSANQPQVSLISNLGQNGVLLPTVKVKLYSRTGSEVHVKALLDCCSQGSLVTTKLIKILGLTPSKENTNIIGVKELTTDTQYSIPLDVYSLTRPYRVTANCNVMDKITCKLPQDKLNLDAINIPDGITLSDIDFHQPSEINLLLGGDIFFQVLLLEPVPGQQQESDEDPASPHPTIVNTKLGYIIGGALSRQQTSDKK
ncbi:uncharacterized protein LOC125234905 [Leguminivora glycinivorella]|uniref:uncharacterized protein LOC125234905 n=2 Tax=Leguminivora glycinivorella TaxID=1035111 RepID=UPI00200C0D04|nr:uncharacterized protein LOC125234905 [Leguminivora glycinivorella]